MVKATIIAGAIGGMLYSAISGDENGKFMKGFLIGAAVQIGVRLLGVS